jgi:hypothetical protein
MLFYSPSFPKLLFFVIPQRGIPVWAASRKPPMELHHFRCM